MKHRSAITKLLAVVGFTTVFLMKAPALAIGSIGDGASSARGIDQPATLFGETGVLSQISSILLFIVGAVAVIMLILGGLRYVISGGDASKVQSAKNTVLYALVGIVVAMLAYAAVNFVIGTFAPGANNSGGITTTNDYGASTR